MADELLRRLRKLVKQLAENEERGERLREERRTILRQLNEQPGWSLEKIGRELGRSKQAVSKWLR